MRDNIFRFAGQEMCMSEHFFSEGSKRVEMQQDFFRKVDEAGGNVSEGIEKLKAAFDEWLYPDKQPKQ